jgi:hypothetical protein
LLENRPSNRAPAPPFLEPRAAGNRRFEGQAYKLHHPRRLLQFLRGIDLEFRHFGRDVFFCDPAAAGFAPLEDLKLFFRDEPGEMLDRLQQGRLKKTDHVEYFYLFDPVDGFSSVFVFFPPFVRVSQSIYPYVFARLSRDGVGSVQRHALKARLVGKPSFPPVPFFPGVKLPHIFVWEVRNDLPGVIGTKPEADENRLFGARVGRGEFSRQRQQEFENLDQRKAVSAHVFKHLVLIAFRAARHPQAGALSDVGFIPMRFGRGDFFPSEHNALGVDDNEMAADRAGVDALSRGAVAAFPVVSDAL